MTITHGRGSERTRLPIPSRDREGAVMSGPSAKHRATQETLSRYFPASPRNACPAGARASDRAPAWRPLNAEQRRHGLPGAPTRSRVQPPRAHTRAEAGLPRTTLALHLKGRPCRTREIPDLMASRGAGIGADRRNRPVGPSQRRCRKPHDARAFWESASQCLSPSERGGTIVPYRSSAGQSAHQRGHEKTRS